jgi:MFS family permease
MARSVAATTGPWFGGAFTPGTSWRWTIYINLPLSVVIWTAFIFSITPLKRAGETASSSSDFLQTLDIIGLTAFITSVVCLLLALQWRGIN